ncbi:MAG: hypothetical protein V4484_12090 [Pseudomonadota bacterium]
MNITKIVASITLLGILAGCASSSVVVGRVRPAISPAQVKLYLHPPQKFEEVALLESNSRASFALTDQGKMNVLIERMKEEAAKVGANGVLLRGTVDQSSGGISTGSFTGNAAIGLTFGLTHKAGSGVAIYVEAE